MSLKYQKMKTGIVCFLFIFFFAGNTLYTQNDVTENNKEKTEFHIDDKRLSFINEALKYLDKPYKYACADESGFDCSGLIYKAAADSLNLQLPRSAFDIADFVTKINYEKALPGDILFFDTMGKISHAGIYIGGGRFIHSASAGEKTGVIISSMEEKYWKSAYRFAGRIITK